MYYDTYRGKQGGGKRSKRPRRRRGCLSRLIGAFFKLIALILVLAVLFAAVLYAMPVSFLNIEGPGAADLSLNPDLPGDRVNILFLGLDYLDEGSQRSDSMIVASVGKDGLRLASILRDTVANIPGHSSDKINSAYAHGGAQMSMQVVNETFGLNITNYVSIGLETLVDLVDAVGGVEIEVEEEELQQLNKYARNTFKKVSAGDPEKYAHYADSQPITQAGKLHLNGIFATSFSRIRKVGADYARTTRQQEVIQAVLKKIRSQMTDPGMYARLWSVYRDSVDTNLSLPELISLAEKVLLSGGGMDTSRFPQAACRYDNGSSIEITDPEGNRRSMQAFLYQTNA